MLVTPEPDEWWQDQLDNLASRDAVQHQDPLLGNLYGMHVYSLLSLEDRKISFLIEGDAPSMELEVLKAGVLNDPGLKLLRAGRVSTRLMCPVRVRIHPRLQQARQVARIRDRLPVVEENSDSEPPIDTLYCVH